MIKFPCKCSHIFNLTEDMAGGLVQCPRCGLLADVPTISELENITEDGAFKINDAAPITDNIELADLHDAFAPGTIDEEGNAIDLRSDAEHFRRIGVRADADPPRVAPKYDPSTGELIRPLELKDERGDADARASRGCAHTEITPIAPMPVIPIHHPKSVGYAVGELRKQVTTATLMLELLMPANAIVMFFIFVLYVIAGFATTILGVGGAFFHISLQILNFPLWLILAHYGCVIEDTGPDSHDELPRPFRHFGLAEDLWNPFIRVFRAGLICFLPALIAGMPRVPMGSLRTPVVLILELIGAFFLPAVLLTTVTGTTSANLRPDRVLAVIRRCGGDYILAVGLLVLSLVPTGFYLIGPAIIPNGADSILLDRIYKPAVAMPVLAICVYLLHFFCWHLGLLYRAHHDEFPWEMQRHIPTTPRTVAPPRKRRTSRGRPY